MKKLRIAFVLIVLVMMVAVTACGSSSGSKKGGKLTLYTPAAAEVYNPIIKSFQEKTGITVEIVAGGTGELLKRIEAEAKNPLGDIFWTAAADSIEAYRDYFEPYKPEEFDKLYPEFVDNTYHWTPFTIVPMVNTYHKELVAENEVPKTWSALLDEKWKGKIAFADPSKSGSSYAQLVGMLTLFGKDSDAGWEYVEKLYENLDGKMLGSSSLVQRGVPDKEFAIGITLEESALRYIEGGSPIGMVYPEDGTLVIPDASAIIKGAKNLDAAKQFTDFLISKEVQEMAVNDFKRRSVRNDVGGLAGVPDLKELKLIDYDANWASSNKTAVMDRFSKIVMGQ